MNLRTALFGRSQNTPDAIPTVVNGKEFKDLWGWARDLIDNGIKARDLMVSNTPVVRNLQASADKYSDRIAKNYQLYRDLGEALAGELNNGSGPVSQNKMLQKMRSKQAMLQGVRGDWTYGPIEDSDIWDAHALNQAKAMETARQGLNSAQVDSLAQTSCFGTALIGFRHSRAIDIPYGDDFFYTCDPLGFLCEFGRCKINGPIFDNSVSRYLVVVDYIDKGALEDEWQIEIDDNYSLVKPEDFSIWHRIHRNRDDQLGDDNRVAEIKIYIRDTTRVPEVAASKKKIPVLTDNQDGLPEIDHYDEQPEVGPDGKPVMKPTGNTVKSFPDHRLIVLCGRTKCYDGRGIYDHKLIPYVRTRNTIDGVNFFGMGDPEIGYGTVRAMDDMARAFDNNVSRSTPLMLLNNQRLVDKDNPFELMDGYTRVRIENLKIGERIEDVMKFEQVPAFTQDQLMYFNILDKWLDDLIGTPPVTYGRTFAADSGVKAEGQDANALRYHKPTMTEEEENLIQLGLMWRCNYRQFPNRHDYPISVVDPQSGKKTKVMLSEAISKLDKDFPIEAIPRSSGGSDREGALAKLGQMMQLLAADPQNATGMRDSILQKFGDPELSAMAQMHVSQREKIVSILQQFDNAGVLDKFVATLQQQMQNQAAQPTDQGGPPAPAGQ